MRTEYREPRLPQDEPIGFEGRTDGGTLVCVLEQRIVEPIDL
jgi:hypothetical protein